jgi:ABC-type sugar transport system substrate-binding protein
MRVLYVNPMEYGTNPAVDALAHGLDHRLRKGGIELRVAYADFNIPDWLELARSAIDRAIEAKVDGMILYILDPRPPHPLATPVKNVRAAGIPVFTFEKPPFLVDGSVVYPNFNQGLFIAEHMTTLVAPGSSVCVIAGPDIADDLEELAGILHGLKNSGLRLLNDPTEDRWKNQTDVTPAGKEIALRLLAEIPAMDGLIVYNDETTLGVLEALDEVGRARQMKILSRNGTPKVVEAVRQGRCDGTWDVDAPAIGEALAEVVIKRLVDNEDTEGELVISPLGRMITQETIDRYLPFSERVPLTPLRTGFDD